MPHRPRYRYYSNAPTTVSLRLADLAAQIPEAARLPGFNAEKTLELSCEEIFSGPVPKLSLSRLAELANEDVRTEGVAESAITLPVARLALAFRFINGRELIEEPPPPKPAKPERSPEDFAPKDEATEAAQEVAPERADPSVRGKRARSKGERDKLPGSELRLCRVRRPLRNRHLGYPAEAQAAEEIKPGEPETWRPINVFPIFRRKVAEPQVKPPVVESRAPAAPNAPSDFAEPPQGVTKPPSAAPKDSAPHLPEAVLVEAERSHPPSRRIEIVDQDALQAVFMTEEMLSIDRVVELCGGLPGHQVLYPRAWRCGPRLAQCARIH